MQFTQILMTPNTFTGSSKRRAEDKEGKSIYEIKIGLLGVRKKVRVKYMKSLFVVKCHMNPSGGDIMVFNNALYHSHNPIYTGQFAAMQVPILDSTRNK